MAVVLELLEEVRWSGKPVAGERTQALLAALAHDGCRAVSSARLIELVWGDDGPANGAKGLQVLVSRTRSAVGADAILTDGNGYRLGLEPAEVDSIRLAELVREADRALPRDATAAADLARAALAQAGGLALDGATDARAAADPLQLLRGAAAEQLARARTVLARALSRTGAHAEALPELERAWREHGGDESIFADLLHSQAAVHGPAAALERYERYRRDLRERLGVNPGESLQALQRELLALDRPVRSGLRYDPTALLGRDRDLERLHGLMRSSRVVSIVGPGGLGKTRLAHVLARDARVPVSHVVELVGVTTGDDVVAEVGAVLGVRDSVGNRRVLTAVQRADVRGRVAQQLGQSPSLLVLDNCEHVVEAVAELVAFLVSATPELRVLTTSRAPLAIAAEHVYLLDQLEPEAARQLFRTRAESARPLVALADDAVTSIVTRLDGLPLAIELAAAKVRVMSVQEIDRRLEDRFALLRGGDRSAPDRHRTLLAVIDWSWNLLGEGERRALRWLALFHDGFTLEAAGAVLGADALEPVQGLVDQSLLKLQERAGSVRYRMLETVREFGRLRLAEACEERAAHDALRRWATAFAVRHGARLGGTDQLEGVDALAAEEVNLADELRAAIADEDRESLVALLAGLGVFWAIRGDHARLIVIAEAVAASVRDWYPPVALEHAARVAMAIVLSNGLITSADFLTPIHELLLRLGPGADTDPRVRGLVRAMLAYDPAAPAAFAERLEALALDPDRYVARAANQWISYLRENAGDQRRALSAAQTALALVDAGDGPWLAAILRLQLAQLAVQLEERELAGRYARASLPVMERLGARDDELQLHALIAMCAILDGRLDEAEAELARIDQLDHDRSIFGGLLFRQVGQAELLLARGQHAAGLRAYRECVAATRELTLPGVMLRGVVAPWVLYAEATALAAHAHYATGEDLAHGAELFALCRADLLALLADPETHIDLPVTGTPLFGLAAWVLLHEAAAPEQAAQMLALAERFAYVRMVPTAAWERIESPLEQRAPGRLAALRAQYAELDSAALLERARVVVAQLGG